VPPGIASGRLLFLGSHELSKSRLCLVGPSFRRLKVGLPVFEPLSIGTPSVGYHEDNSVVLVFGNGEQTIHRKSFDVTRRAFRQLRSIAPKAAMVEHHCAALKSRCCELAAGGVISGRDLTK
jgi:hypothetical protein